MPLKLFTRKLFNTLIRRKQPIYTADWFSNHIDNWNEWLSPLQNLPYLRFLEIGSYEGRATRWLLENILTHSTSKIVCIDNFEGSMPHQEQNTDMAIIKQNFYHNIRPYRKKVTTYIESSQQMIRANPSLFPEYYFDFIYIDGSQKSCDVLEDIVLSFRTLKNNGLMILDDYDWVAHKDPRFNPKLAIDAWLACFDGQYEMLYKNQQICIKKCGLLKE